MVPRPILLALLWAASGAVIGALCWGALGAIVYPLMSAASLADVVRFWPPRFLAAAYFGGFIAVVVLPFYASIFASWLYASRRHPSMEASIRSVARGSFVLALPLGAAVFLGNLWSQSTLGLFWRHALILSPFALASAWVAIFLPRVAVPALRPAVPSIAPNQRGRGQGR